MTSKIIETMLAHIEGECPKIDTDKAYDDMLDECSECCSMCKQFGASRILAELDPIAYRCGKNDWLDGQSDQWTEINWEYYETREVDKAKDEFIGQLNDELTELETERDDLDEDAFKAYQKLVSAIADKEAEIKECEDHSF